MAVNMQSSKMACAGSAVGLLLLATAGVLVVTRPTPMTPVVVPERRLQEPVAAPPSSFGPDFKPSDHFDPEDPAMAQYHAAMAQYNASAAPLSPGQQGVIAAAYTTYFLTIFLTQIGTLVVYVVFAVMYKSKVVDQVLDQNGTLKQQKKKFKDQEDDFHNGICGCFDNIWVVIHTLCCPLARMAHTNAVSGVLGYWETVGAFFCLACFCNALGPMCATVYFRHEQKKIMNVKDNIVNDVIIACLCPTLAICQQGDAADFAQGYEVTGCCDLEWNDDAGSGAEE